MNRIIAIDNISYILEYEHEIDELESLFPGIQIDKDFITNIVKLLKLYNTLSYLYNDRDTLILFHTLIKSYVLTEEYQPFINYRPRHIFREFYKLYLYLTDILVDFHEKKKIIRYRRIIRNLKQIGINIDISNIIKKYDYYFHGTEELTLKEHERGITCIATLHNRIISGSNNLRIWNIKTQTIKRILIGHTDYITCIGVLPDGRIISGSNDSTLIIWNNGEIENLLVEHQESVSCVAVLSESRIVSGSDDGTLRVWDLKTNEQAKIYGNHAQPVLCVAILPDGKIVSGSWDKTLRIWDPETGKTERIYKEHKQSVINVIVFSHDKIISADGEEIRIWNRKNGVTEKTYRPIFRRITCMVILPNKDIMIGFGDGQLMIWDIEEIEPGHLISIVYRKPISGITVLHDGRIVCSFGKSLRIMS